MPTCELTEEDFADDNIDILTILTKSGLAASRSEARRNVEQGGVSVDGTQIKDIKAVFAKDQFAGDGVVVKRGKKNFKKVILKYPQPLRRQLPAGERGLNITFALSAARMLPQGASAGNTPLTATTPSREKANKPARRAGLFAIFKIIFPLILSEQSGDNSKSSGCQPSKISTASRRVDTSPTLPGKYVRRAREQAFGTGLPYRDARPDLAQHLGAFHAQGLHAHVAAGDAALCHHKSRGSGQACPRSSAVHR